MLNVHLVLDDPAGNSYIQVRAVRCVFGTSFIQTLAKRNHIQSQEQHRPCLLAVPARPFPDCFNVSCKAEGCFKVLCSCFKVVQSRGLFQGSMQSRGLFQGFVQSKRSFLFCLLLLPDLFTRAIWAFFVCLNFQQMRQKINK